MMTGVVRLCCLIFLTVFSGVPSTHQLPVRVKPVDPQLFLAAEDPETSPDVVSENHETKYPLENIGIEPNQGFLIEGDIRVWHGASSQENTNSRTGDLYRDSNGINSHQTRNTVGTEETWLEKVIPYVIDPTFNFTERQTIKDAINEIMTAVNNCTVFVEREKQEDFLYITGQNNGCFSDVGKQGGNQTVSISRASECVSKGIIMHELLHALGFWHEHTRPDRDKYIEILYNNVILGYSKNFDVKKNGKMLVDYDYYSIMHYKINQFSKNHQSLNTMRILQPGIDETQVGQRLYLSDKDKERIIRLYQCRKLMRSASNSTQSSNLTQSSEYLGNQGIQYSPMPIAPNSNRSDESVQNAPQTLVQTEAPLEHLPGPVSTSTNKQEIVLKSNFTETAEVGRK